MASARQRSSPLAVRTLWVHVRCMRSQSRINPVQAVPSPSSPSLPKVQLERMSSDIESQQTQQVPDLISPVPVRRSSAALTRRR